MCECQRGLWLRGSGAPGTRDRLRMPPVSPPSVSQHSSFRLVDGEPTIEPINQSNENGGADPDAL